MAFRMLSSVTSISNGSLAPRWSSAPALCGTDPTRRRFGGASEAWLSFSNGFFGVFVGATEFDFASYLCRECSWAVSDLLLLCPRCRVSCAAFWRWRDRAARVLDFFRDHPCLLVLCCAAVP